VYLLKYYREKTIKQDVQWTDVFNYLLHDHLQYKRWSATMQFPSLILPVSSTETLAAMYV